MAGDHPCQLAANAQALCCGLHSFPEFIERIAHIPATIIDAEDKHPELGIRYEVSNTAQSFHQGRSNVQGNGCAHQRDLNDLPGVHAIGLPLVIGGFALGSLFLAHFQ